MRVKLSEVIYVKDYYYYDTDFPSRIENTVSGMMLYGTATGSGIYFKLSRAGVKNKWREYNSMSIRADRLLELINNHLRSNGRKDTVKNVAVPINKATVPASSKGWIVGSVTNGVFSIATTPKIHSTESSVNTEIERLAKLNTDKIYVKMKLEGYAQAGGVVWS